MEGIQLSILLDSLLISLDWYVVDVAIVVCLGYIVSGMFDGVVVSDYIQEKK
jgi:hypothetical protein